MFICVDGIMGSGKTYFAVDYMFKHMQKYYKIYNNINEFKYQYNIYPLSFGWLFKHLKVCHDIFIEQRNQDITNDEAIVSYLIENDIIGKNKEPILITIDEAHNEFAKKDDFTTWIITYHRHLYIDFVLITQSYSLINREYYKLFEYFLNAVPASLKMSGKSFKYVKHITAPYGKDTKAGAEYLQARQDVFALYKSGDKVRVKSFLRKYILITLLIALVTVFAFFQYIRVFFGGAKTKSQDSIKQVQKVSQSDITDKKFLSFNCVKGLCTIDSTTYKLSDVIYLVKESKSILVRDDVYSDKYSEVSILASPLFFNLIKKADDNEKDTFFNSDNR